MTLVSDASPNLRPELRFNPLGWRRWWLAIDRNETVLAWAQTFTGQAVLHATLLGTLLLMPILRTSHVALMAVALMLCWALPQRRLLVLSVTGMVYFLLRPFKIGPYYGYLEQIAVPALPMVPAPLIAIPFGLLFLVFAVAMVRNQERKALVFASDRPLLFMFLIGGALAAASIGLPREHVLFAPVWIALAYLTSSFFFLGYVLLDQRSKTRIPVHAQLGFLRPFWAGFAAPMKGPAFILKSEAKTDAALAVSRLKGLKLAIWALILFLIWEWVFNRLIHDYLAFPRLDDLIAASAAGAPAPLALRWGAVAVEFMAMVIYMGAAIHAVVAVVRVAGFCIPRGMARPLSSRTIAEFWGRYLFYFKEMLVDFFFYPTFRRYFKNHPRLRMAFATFAAAFVGNVLFDFIHVIPSVAFEGGERILQGFASYCVYAGILTAGIIWSQLMQSAPRPEQGFLRYSVLPRAQVIVFFALLQVIDDSSANVLIGDRLTYLTGLFGVNL
jgi:hypothetical protein